MKPYQRRLQRKLKEEKGKRENAVRRATKFKFQRDELANIVSKLMTEEQLDTTVNGEMTVRHILTLILPPEVKDEV